LAWFRSSHASFSLFRSAPQVKLDAAGVHLTFLTDMRLDITLSAM